MHPDWDEIEEKALDAIASGYTLLAFLEKNKIKKRDWYRLKPAGWHWTEKQTELGVERRGVGGRPPDSPYSMQEHEKRLSMMCRFIASEIESMGLNKSLIKQLLTAIEIAEM